MASSSSPLLFPEGHLILVVLDDKLPTPKLLTDAANGQRTINGVSEIIALRSSGSPLWTTLLGTQPD